RPPEEREYCVQHRETDLQFLERLAAEEGWHYRYQHGSVDGEEQPALILADHHGDAPKLDPVTCNTKAGGSTQQACVFQFAYEERVKAASVAMKDYTFKNPAYALMHEHSAGGVNHRDDKIAGSNFGQPQAGPARGEAHGRAEHYQHYDYPGRYKADASGQPFTQNKLDALRNDASMANGKSNRPDFTPGAKVELQDHDSQTLNREWLLTAITHTGKQPQALEEEGGSEPTSYHNTFSAIPADKTWRPLCNHKPVMDGPQMALVTGPEGEEIHCDQYGRVKVRFPWDRYSKNDEHSSAWLRVAQGWAGGQYGFMALPRIGHEVIVSFLDGDPDQPIITGRTYHATNTPPYALPEHKTRTTLKTKTHKGEGSNELRFEDEAGEEQVYVHAQKDLDLLTENNRTEVIKNDSHLTVENHQFSHIKAADHCTTDGENRLSVGADCSQTVGGTYHQKTARAMAAEAGTEVHHKAGAKVVLDAGAELTISGGGSFIKLDPSGVTLSGPGIKINSGGSPGSGSGQGTVAPELPAVLDRDRAAMQQSPELAMVSQRKGASPDQTEFEQLPGSDRKLIIDVIGGHLERDSVEAVKGSEGAESV
ncbi:type VI secretion system Vgr family protein, partial [Marinobacter sp. ST-43]|uniref:type VI secretion system Vgr family protein n=1 Tax=Marinobacter sp. ST-43 TaxID=3050453 RepID=UPI0026DF3184